MVYESTCKLTRNGVYSLLYIEGCHRNGSPIQHLERLLCHAARSTRSGAHVARFLDILFLTLCAVICGMNDWEAIEEWGQARQDWLRHFVALDNGIPSHDTLARVFAALDSARFEQCFVRWMSTLIPLLEGEIVAIDGKTARGSRDRDQAALHMVSAFVCGRGIKLGQWKTDEKSNEITAS